MASEFILNVVKIVLLAIAAFALALSLRVSNARFAELSPVDELYHLKRMTHFVDFDADRNAFCPWPPLYDRAFGALAHGHGLAWIRWFPPILGALFVALTVVWLDHRFGQAAAIAAGIALATSPFIVTQSWVASIDHHWTEATLVVLILAALIDRRPPLPSRARVRPGKIASCWQWSPSSPPSSSSSGCRTPPRRPPSRTRGGSAPHDFCTRSRPAACSRRGRSGTCSTSTADARSSSTTSAPCPTTSPSRARTTPSSPRTRSRWRATATTTASASSPTSRRAACAPPPRSSDSTSRRSSPRAPSGRAPGAARRCVTSAASTRATASSSWSAADDLRPRSLDLAARARRDLLLRVPLALLSDPRPHRLARPPAGADVPRATARLWRA